MTLTLFIQILNICVVVKKIHSKGTQTIVVSERYPLEFFHTVLHVLVFDKEFSNFHYNLEFGMRKKNLPLYFARVRKVKSTVKQKGEIS